MIIWRGYGLAIFGVVFGLSLVANLLANAFGGHDYWDTHGWPLAASLAVDALVFLTIDRILSERESRLRIDETPGNRSTPPVKHDLFFIGFRWWALILAVLAALIVLSHWSPGPS